MEAVDYTSPEGETFKAYVSKLPIKCPACGRDGVVESSVDAELARLNGNPEAYVAQEDALLREVTLSTCPCREEAAAQ